jgi:hypothetical protein
VRAEIPPAHALEDRQHRHIRKRLVLLAAREDEVALTNRVHLLENGNRCCGQRHPVLAAGLHPRFGNHPQLFVQVDLVPSRADYLASACCGQDQELQCPCRDSILGPEQLEEIAYFIIGQCRVVFDLLYL